jgi:predicted pyridoxine 5'-phosphate oxidase superfamily flavin-nucleotide-binding protein
MDDDGVFHEGERLLQERAGQRTVARANSKILRDVIPEGARPFLATQRMVVVSHGTDRVWAWIAFGEAGFVSSDDGAVVRFDHGLPSGVPVGLLLIDFASRKRLRVNVSRPQSVNQG